MDPSGSRTRVELTPPLKRFLLLLSLLTAVCVGTELFCGLVLHWGYPWNWPLTPRYELGYDLNGFIPKFRAFHSRAFFSIEPQYAFAYPAGMAVLYWLVYRVPTLRWELLLCLIGLSFAGAGVLMARTLVHRGLRLRDAALLCGGTLLLSYPIAFEAKQGNLEFFLWLLSVAGLVLLQRHKPYSAATCFCVAGVLKPYLLVFLGLQVARRQWKPLLLAVTLFPAGSLAALWLLCPDLRFAITRLHEGVSLFQSRIILQVVAREIGFDHSLFALLKRLWPGVVSLRPILPMYVVVTALAGVLLFFIRIRRLGFARQVLALSVCAILLPPVSYDYTLLYLYAPLALFALEAVQQNGAVERRQSLVLALLAVALAPLSELIRLGVGFGGQVRSVILVLLLIAAVAGPAEDRGDAVVSSTACPVP